MDKRIFDVLEPSVLKDLYVNGKTQENIKRLAWVSIAGSYKAVKRLDPGVSHRDWFEMLTFNLSHQSRAELIETAILVLKKNSEASLKRETQRSRFHFRPSGRKTGSSHSLRLVEKPSET